MQMWETGQLTSFIITEIKLYDTNFSKLYDTYINIKFSYTF